MPRQIPRSLLSIQMSRRALMHVERLGLSRTYLADLYHVFVTASWSKLFLTLGLLFVVSNVAFAGAYLLGGDCIRGARPGSFLDAFFFSVQTMATIGYGHMTPATLWADVLVTMQAFVGLVGTAVSTGLIFAKFAVPTARIVFSDVAVVCPQDGVESLVFRMANERGNLLVAPSLSAVVELDERSAEGRQVRRYHELKLARGTMPIFAFTWTATHPIDAESPLAGMDAASLERADARIYVALTAIEEDLVHTIHARHTWRPEDLRWGERFVEIVTRARGDRVRVDYTRFHETVPYEG
jgi:inward rectifier potassium channel